MHNHHAYSEIGPPLHLRGHLCGIPYYFPLMFRWGSAPVFAMPSAATLKVPQTRSFELKGTDLRHPEPDFRPFTALASTVPSFQLTSGYLSL